MATNFLKRIASSVFELMMVHEKLDNNPYIINSLLGYPVDFNAGF